MKLTLYKKQRITFISALVLFIILITFLIYNSISNPGFKDEKIQLYSYNYKTTIDYNVYLKQNNLYNETYLNEGKIYITEFVDHINANLKFEFLGERATDIKGEYNIIAKVNGFTGEGEKLVNIWEKDFPIKQHNWFNSKDGKIKINEQVKFNISEYNAFVTEIKEASKINCQTNLTLLININMIATTDKGLIEKNISPSLIIPLDVDMFEISENNIVDQKESIEETIKVPIRVNKNLSIVLGIILSLLLIALVIIIFFIKVEPEKDPIEKEVRKIFKKHGDRLVALNSDIIIKDSVFVKSIDDLVKISDESEKPILYKYSDDYKEINMFYVSNDIDTYIFEINNLAEAGQIENTKDIIADNTSEV